MPPKTMRGPSSNSVLKLVWEYPVYTPPKSDDAGPTVAPKRRAALSEIDAFAYIAGKDPRPLLVLRECKNCNGTDDALLSRGNEDNERTFLLSRWFHCVKLPVDVLQADHPFHSLFPGDDPEHMFFCAADGTGRIPMESERSRVELWGSMMQVLKANYAKDPEESMRKMERVIDEFDELDQRITALEQKIDGVVETDGPESHKLKKLQSELEAAKHDRGECFSAIDAASAELKLKKAKAAPAEAQPKRS
jgi:hypothetical protein